MCWKAELAVLTEDIPGTIAFFDTECTAAEYSWISEIIEDLATQTQSRELIESYKALMLKYPDEYKTYNISDFVQSAENLLCEG